MLLILAIIYFIFNRRIPQTSSGIMHSDPWILVESDSSDDEEITSISKDVERQILMVNKSIEYKLFHESKAFRHHFFFVYRDGTPPCDKVLDVATLLRNHITSNVLLAKTVVFIIRRSKPWKSFMREMKQHKVDDCMDFEVFSFWNTIAIAAMNFTIRDWLLIIGGGGAR